MSYENVELKYQIIRINGVDFPVFLPSFWSEELQDWLVVGKENPMPVTIKNKQEMIDLLTKLDMNQDEYKNLITQLNGLIEQMQLMATGPKGDSFTYDDFTQGQLDDLKGEKGDPFIYDDFTKQQLADLKGEKGDTGEISQKTFDSHVNNGSVHFTSNEKNKAMTEVSESESHRNDAAIHVTGSDKTKWNEYEQLIKTQSDQIDTLVNRLESAVFVEEQGYYDDVYVYKYSDGVLDMYIEEFVLDRGFSNGQFLRGDRDLPIPFVDNKYAISAILFVAGSLQYPIVYARTKKVGSLELAAISADRSFDPDEGSVTYNVGLRGRWK